MTIQELTFRDYLAASDAKEQMDYYINLFGDVETAMVMITYHLKTKTPRGLGGVFKTIKDVSDMTFGQFISAEVVLSSGNNSVENIKKLATIIIRPLDEEYYSNDDEEAEKALEETILNYDAREIVEEIERFKDIRDKFIKEKYRGVFYMVDRENKELTEEEVSGKNKEQDEFVKQWYWYAITRRLAEENIVIRQDTSVSKFENALNTKMSFVAPDIAYNRHKQILEEIEEKKRKMKNNEYS